MTPRSSRSGRDRDDPAARAAAARADGDPRARVRRSARWRRSEGLVGKAYCLTRNAPVAACVERLVAPVVTGRGGDPEASWEACSRATVAIGRTGLVVRAIGLVDVALWDIAAQAAGVPLWRHLGASAPAARADGGRLPARRPQPRVARRGRRSLRDGRVQAAEDRPRPGPARMRRLLETAAAGLPAGARLVVDGGLRLALERGGAGRASGMGRDAARLARGPARAGGRRGLRGDPAPGPYPVGVGDEVTHIGTFRALLDAGALDVLRLDVLAIGGITPARARAGARGRAGGAGVVSHLPRGERAPGGGRARRHRRDVRPATYPAATPSTPLICSTAAAPRSPAGARRRPTSPGSASSWTGRASLTDRRRARPPAAAARPRRILPVTVSGSSATNSISRGTSYGASRVRTCSWSSAASSGEPRHPATVTTNAFTTSPRTASGTPIDGRDRHRRMPDQALLDLAGADPVAAARDEVVDPADAAVGALVVDLGEVAGVQPAVSHLRGRRLLVAPVAEEHDRVALDANRDLAVDETRARARDTARPIEPGRAGQAAQLPISEVRLGLAVELVQAHAEPLLAPRCRLLADRLAAAREGAQRHGHSLGATHQPQRRRGHEDVADAERARSRRRPARDRTARARKATTGMPWASAGMRTS